MIDLVANVPTFGYVEACNNVKGNMPKFLERGTKYTVVKSDDPHSQILFKSAGMGNYYLHIDKILKMVEDWPSSSSVALCLK